MSINYPNTEPLVEEVLNNFFTEADAEEFNSNYLAAEQPQDVSDEKLKEKFDVDLQSGIRTRSQVNLLITFAENQLSKEKFIDLLLFVGQSTITSGEFSTALEIHEKLARSSEDTPQMKNIAANAFLRMGEVYSGQAKWELSFNYLGKAEQLCPAENDVKGNAECENLMGTIFGDKGELQKAVEHFENALAFLEDNPDNVLKGKIEINLGIINNIQGKYDSALSYFRRALLNFEKADDIRRVAEVRQDMGMVYTQKKEFREALSEFDLSLMAAKEVNYLQSFGINYLSKAYVYTQLSDFDFAEAFADKSMEVAYKLDDKLTIAEVYKIKGIIQRNKNKFAAAANYLLTSLRLNNEIGNKLNQAETSYELGILYDKADDKDKSKEYFADALEYYKMIDAEEEIKEIEKLIK